MRGAYEVGVVAGIIEVLAARGRRPALSTSSREPRSARSTPRTWRHTRIARTTPLESWPRSGGACNLAEHARVRPLGLLTGGLKAKLAAADLGRVARQVAARHARPRGARQAQRGLGSAAQEHRSGADQRALGGRAARGLRSHHDLLRARAGRADRPRARRATHHLDRAHCTGSRAGLGGHSAALSHATRRRALLLRRRPALQHADRSRHPRRCRAPGRDLGALRAQSARGGGRRGGRRRRGQGPEPGLSGRQAARRPAPRPGRVRFARAGAPESDDGSAGGGAARA